MSRHPLGASALLCAALLLGVSACARPERLQGANSVWTNLACTPLNPLMQTHVLEAVVAGGGPQHVDVAGWMCGRRELGHVRIVFLRYTPDQRGEAPFLIPVIFEHGAMVALGWHLLEAQPDRYQTEMPLRDEPWRVPSGWACFREAGGGAVRGPSAAE